MADKIDVRELVSTLWISVDKVLPKESGLYLCYVKGFYGRGYMTVCQFTLNLEEVDAYDFVGKNHPGFFEYDSEEGFIEEPVLYWMPLPYPPTEE